MYLGVSICDIFWLDDPLIMVSKPSDAVNRRILAVSRYFNIVAMFRSD